MYPQTEVDDSNVVSHAHIMAPAIDRSESGHPSQENGSGTEKEIKVLVTGFGVSDHPLAQLSIFCAHCESTH